MATIFDIGSSTLKVGHSSSSDPQVYDSLVARYRERKTGQQLTICGQDIQIDSYARQNARSLFDGQLLVNFDMLEVLVDYSMIKLGLKEMGHAIITEPLANTPYCRGSTSELFFEAYNAKSVTYGIDSLFSYYENGGKTGLVISSSNSSTDLIVVSNGQAQLNLAKRLNYGGSQALNLMLKLLALKYPEFPFKLTKLHVQPLLQEYLYVADDYETEVEALLKDPSRKDDSICVQFPFIETAPASKTPEELARIAERRRQQGERLQKLARQKRLEKLNREEAELESYNNILNNTNTPSRRQALRDRVVSDGFKDENDLRSYVKKLEESVRKARLKQLGEEDLEEEKVDEVPKFPLIDIPDSELDEAQIKMKRQQKLLKGNYEARMRARAEKKAEEERQKALEEQEIRFRQENLEEWINNKREERESVLKRIKDRERLRQELSDRKSLASQMRMKSIASLAGDNHKRRRRDNRKDDDDDTFGADDADWAVYRDIAQNASDSDEDHDHTKLVDIESKLIEYDDNFHEGMTYQAMRDPTKTLMNSFQRAGKPFNSEDTAQLYQIHLNVERVRIPEVLFQPSLGGIDQAGIVEIAKSLLYQMDGPISNGFGQDIFLTGGFTKIPHLDNRLFNECRSILPSGYPVSVRRAADPILDPWRGARRFVQTDLAIWQNARVTREEYNEMGNDYIKEYGLGNL